MLLWYYGRMKAYRKANAPAYNQKHTPSRKATAAVVIVFVLVALFLAFISGKRWYMNGGKGDLIAAFVFVRGDAAQPETESGDNDIFEGDASDIATRQNMQQQRQWPDTLGAAGMGYPPPAFSAGSTAMPAIAESSLVPLDADEQILASLMADVDGDSFPDQVLAVNRNGSVKIVFVRYNSASSLYTRDKEGTVNAQNISLSVMDMTGDHNMEIIVHGTSLSTDGNGQYATMDVFSTGEELKKIGDFKADSIYIDAIDRTAAYNLSQAAGAPYHVWTYQDEADGRQTRIEWNYSAKENKYIAIARQRLAASDVKEREMAHIRSTISSFNNFLNGLWCREENTDGNRFVYFDKSAKEIIFVYQNTEELYVWQAGSLRGRTAVVTATNAAIKTMHRRLDVSVMSMDEIHFRITDDIRIVQNDTSAWDGTYRKMRPNSRLPSAAQTAE